MTFRVLLLGLVACAHAQPVASPAPSERSSEEPVVYETRPRYVNLLPLGAGQFQNGEPGKGVGLAIAEGATAATSVGIFIYLVDQYGTRSSSVPISDAGRVQRLQRIEIATGVAFFGLYAIGVIDAMRHFQPRVRVRGTTVTLGPIRVHDGAGFGVAWSH
jgi:hypothetical protein